MLPGVDEAGADQLNAVIAQIVSKLPGDQGVTVEAFTRQYFRQVDQEDMAERRVADLYGVVLSHWNFVRKHTGGTRLRVYNPRLEEHGWESTHTVIEIVSDDMPFLVDSIGMEVNRQGLTLHLMIHPVMKVVRDASGQFVKFAGEGDAAGGGEVARYESIIHVEVDRRTEVAALQALEAGLQRILGDVRAAVEDWPRLTQRVVETIVDIGRNPPPQDAGQTVEDCAFLQWLHDGNFTLLGYREYDLLTDGAEDVLRVVAGSGLGILRETGRERSLSFAALPAEVRLIAREPRLLVLTKANARATVHRPGYLVYVGIKRFDGGGQVVGERRFLGLFTSTAYSANTTEIPLLRRKIAGVMNRAGFLPKSHAAKTLLTVLEQYPRDELFQIDEETLFATVMGILRLGERQRIRLFVRRDAFARFVACLIYVPRENYNTEQRLRMQAVLMEAFGGVFSEFEVHFSESALARIFITVRTGAGGIPAYDVRELEARLVRVARRWEDDLQQALLEHCGEERGMYLSGRYAGAFPAGYREDYPARVAVHDIEQIELLGTGDGLRMSLYVPLEASPGQLRFKIFRAGAPVPLSASLPMLEHMGVRVIEERPARIEVRGDHPVWVHDFGMTCPGAEEMDIDRLRPLFQDAFLSAWEGAIENDDFNRLTLLAGLDWREVSVLRAYAKYMRQATFYLQPVVHGADAGQPPAAGAAIDRAVQAAF